MSTASINEVHLIGNLGGDVNFRTVGAGIPVASFNMATTYHHGEDERTEWHRIVLWKGLAERAHQYLRKGSSVFIAGRLHTRRWKDKDGIVRYTTEIVGETMQMLESRAFDQAGGAGDERHDKDPAGTTQRARSKKASTRPAPPPAGPEPEEDDIPF